MKKRTNKKCGKSALVTVKKNNKEIKNENLRTFMDAYISLLDSICNDIEKEKLADMNHYPKRHD